MEINPESLVEELEDVIELQSLSNQTPLLVAAANNQFEMFKVLLLEYHANLDVYDTQSKNALHHAAFFENEAFIKFLISVSAEKGNLNNVIDIFGKTPAKYMNDDLKCYLPSAYDLIEQGTQKNMKEIKHMIQNKIIKVNEQTYFGKNTLLHFSVAY